MDHVLPILVKKCNYIDSPLSPLTFNQMLKSVTLNPLNPLNSLFDFTTKVIKIVYKISEVPVKLHFFQKISTAIPLINLQIFLNIMSVVANEKLFHFLWSFNIRSNSYVTTWISTGWRKSLVLEIAWQVSFLKLI